MAPFQHVCARGAGLAEGLWLNGLFPATARASRSAAAAEEFLLWAWLADMLSLRAGDGLRRQPGRDL